MLGSILHQFLLSLEGLLPAIDLCESRHRGDRILKGIVSRGQLVLERLCQFVEDGHGDTHQIFIEVDEVLPLQHRFHGSDGASDTRHGGEAFAAQVKGLLLQLTQTVLNGGLAVLHRLRGIDFHLLVGMDPDACSTGCLGRAREIAVLHGLVALQRDVLGLVDDGRL